MLINRSRPHIRADGIKKEQASALNHNTRLVRSYKPHTKANYHKMKDLYLHCGSTPCELPDIQRASTPSHTDTHYPIKHDHLLGLVEDTLTDQGLDIVKKRYGLGHKGHNMFATFEIEKAGAGEDNGTFRNIVGIRNSHIKHFSAGLVAGSRVFVCDNLAFSGEIKCNRKHTRNILKDLPNIVNYMVGQLNDKWLHQEIRYEAYSATELEQTQADQLMGLAFRKQCLPGSKFQKVLQEWEKPSHDEFEPRNAWSMFNAFTEVQKSSPSTIQDRSILLHNTFNSFCQDTIDDLMAERSPDPIDITHLEDTEILVN